MRQLEVVAVSDDGDFVLLAGSEEAVRATHQLRIDNRLRSAIRGQLETDKDRRESELTPKEIQARLRAGDAPEQIAQAARVSVSRVMRYAGPVISERERIIDQARAAVLHRSREPQPSLPLGEVVEKRLAATAGLRADSVGWTARRRDDGAWIVVLAYTARGGSRTASWLWEPGNRELTSLNALATRLGGAPVPAGDRRHGASGARKAAAKKTPARKPAKKGGAKKATTSAGRGTAARSAPAATPKGPRRQQASPAPIPVERVNGRAVTPSWDDVLIGVQSPAKPRGRRKA
ncbi:MAG TPA: septation protein SepH [Mycobacteriales bacterium]|nr:septation protein SepH [Mycobacteriales bacterium]